MEAYQYKIRVDLEQSEKKDLNFNPCDLSLNQTTLKLIDSITAKNIILKYEWLKTMPYFNKYIFGLYFNVNEEEHLGGVVIYSEEYSANKSAIWEKYNFNKKIILLSRGVCLWWTPKNTASFFISKTIEWLKLNTSYKIITATVDPAAGEIGTIYQALNWHYVGLMGGNYIKGKESKRFSVLINGKLRYSRSIRNEFGTMKKEVILQKYPDAIFLPQYRKRRYFYFIGTKRENKDLFENIKYLILPYPKRNNDIVGVIYLINNKVNNKKYVGQTTRGFNIRHDEYRRGEKCCNPYVLKAIEKYGWNNFEFSIIDSAQTIDELNFKEIRYISEYNTTNRSLGYNIESGGINSPANEETVAKLSKLRKEVKQNPEWIKKRVDQVSKPVIKMNTQSKVVLEKYPSLADAGKNNKDGLSYHSILRLCLAYGKQRDNITWCYEEDFNNNSIPIYTKTEVVNKNDLSEELVDKLYYEYKNNNISIRELSKVYSINFSTLSTIFKKREKPKSFFVDGCSYIAICKKTNKKFSDHINKSGALTNHIIETYPDFILNSLFKRKQIEMQTGKPWYFEYFDFKKN